MADIESGVSDINWVVGTEKAAHQDRRQNRIIFTFIWCQKIIDIKKIVQQSIVALFKRYCF